MNQMKHGYAFLNEPFGILRHVRQLLEYNRGRYDFSTPQHS